MRSFLWFVGIALINVVLMVMTTELQARAEVWSSTKNLNKTDKKKIVIFTFNKGGFGHKAASQSLNNLLHSTYDISTIDLSEYLGMGRSLGGWEVYDKWLRGGWIRFTNVICRFVPPYLKIREKRFQNKVCRLLEKEKPDLVVSVISYFDGLLFHACDELDIPLLMVTTDGDLTNWMVGIEKDVQPKLKVTIGFESDRTRGLLREVGVEDQDIMLTGFPIRQDFLEKKDLAAIRRKWHVPENKFTALLLMGGAGAAATDRYARRLIKMDLPMHLIVCAGSNKPLYSRLLKMKKKSLISMTVVPFTERISDLMAVSDLLITKAGPGSINEALYMNVPMLIDRTSAMLFWERENVNFVEHNQFGEALDSLLDLEHVLEEFIYHRDECLSRYKKNLIAYQKPNFDQHVTALVQELCPLPQLQSLEHDKVTEATSAQNLTI